MCMFICCLLEQYYLLDSYMDLLHPPATVELGVSYMWWRCACVYTVFIYPDQHYGTFPIWQLISFFGSRKFLLFHLIVKKCTYTKCIGCMHSMQRITNQYLCLTELSWVSLLLHVLSLESSTWLCLAENPSGKNFWKKVSLTCPLELKSVAQMIENLPVMQKTWVWSLGQEDPLEKGMATHSRILAQRIPMGSQKVGHNWATNKYTHTNTNTHPHTHTRPFP